MASTSNKMHSEVYKSIKYKPKRITLRHVHFWEGSTSKELYYLKILLNQSVITKKLWHRNILMLLSDFH